MADYHLYNQSSEEFEELVIQICRNWLGQGISSFSSGRDGGRDAKFSGTANEFPSKASPASGKFIIQAKSAESPDASCSDLSFWTQLKKELTKIRNLKDNNELDNYLLFTNRKKSGDYEEKVVKYLVEETGVKKVWLTGRRDIELYLDTQPETVQLLGLDKLRSPLRIHPDELAAVIRGFDSNKHVVDSAINSMKNFPKYPGIVKKNKINGLTEDYFQYIQKNSTPYFAEIKEFLEKARNVELKRAYHNAADELHEKIIVHRSEFNEFDRIFVNLYDQFVEQCPQLKGMAQLIHVFLHYMYCNCDFGKSQA